MAFLSPLTPNVPISQNPLSASHPKFKPPTPESLPPIRREAFRGIGGDGVLPCVFRPFQEPQAPESRQQNSRRGRRENRELQGSARGGGKSSRQQFKFRGTVGSLLPHWFLISSIDLAFFWIRRSNAAVCHGKKIRKKVSFNPNVESYEPIPDDHRREDEEENGKNGAGNASEGWNSTAPIMASFPSNYRYQNFGDGIDDEDEMVSMESDLEDDDIYESADDETEIGAESKSVEKASTDFYTSPSREATCPGRSQKECSVLRTVENLSQWKAIKAKPVQRLKTSEKEDMEGLQQDHPVAFSSKSLPTNFMAPCRIAAEMSLSDWVASSETVPATQSRNIASVAMLDRVSLLACSDG